MNKFIIKSFDVYVDFTAGQQVFNMTPDEAFTFINLPALRGLCSKLVPCYEVVTDELPEMPEE